MVLSGGEIRLKGRQQDMIISGGENIFPLEVGWQEKMQNILNDKACHYRSTVTKEMVRTMAKKPIIFACANPTPEIFPAEAKEAGAAVVSAVVLCAWLPIRQCGCRVFL